MYSAVNLPRMVSTGKILQPKQIKTCARAVQYNNLVHEILKPRTVLCVLKLGTFN